MTTRERSNDTGPNTRVLLGSAIALIGFAMLADRNDEWGLFFNINWWPFLLIFIGVAQMVAPGEGDGGRRSKRPGLWLLSIGAWGLIVESQLFGFDYSNSWPLLIIALGADIVWKALETPPVSKTQEH